MNNTEKIFEMLGVEPNEVFEADFTGELKDYCLDKDLNLRNVGGSFLSPRRTIAIISGEIPIVKKPWKPKEKEEYWYIYPGGDVLRTSINSECLLDIGNLSLGNYFKTEKEAEDNKGLILNKIAEVLK